MSKSAIKSYKIVILGDSSVGKTSIANQFSNGTFSELQDSTIGAAFFSKTRTVDGKEKKVEIWDTAGQERYHSLAPMYYRGAKGALVVFDITSTSSFNRAKMWVTELRIVSNLDIPITLVGNKSDLEKNRQVSNEMAYNYSQENELTYIETSAKNNVNIEKIFDETVRNIPEQTSLYIEDDTVSLSNKAIVKRKCC